MNNVVLETLAPIFTIEDSVFKILLIRKKTEPYKGYWILPGGIVNDDKTINECISESVLEQAGIDNLNFEQSYVFSDIDRVPDKRVIAVSLISIVDEIKIKSHQVNTNYESAWFPIDQLPKIGYDHAKVIDVAVSQLKIKLNQS